MRASLLAALPLLIVLAGCQKEPKQEAAPEPSAAASAGTEARPGLSASGGQLLLPSVKGRPGAAYFTLVNGGDQPVTLAAVSIAGAEKAEMHETSGGSMEPVAAIAVKPGETVSFARGGRHVMAFGLAPSVTAGGSAEMTLTFADGDKLSVPLKVSAMAGAAAQPATGGGGGGTMSGMDMGHGDAH